MTDDEVVVWRALSPEDIKTIRAKLSQGPPRGVFKLPRALSRTFGAQSPEYRRIAGATPEHVDRSRDGDEIWTVICYVHAAGTVLYANGQEIVPEDGDAVLMPPGTKHSATSKGAKILLGPTPNPKPIIPSDAKRFSPLRPQGAAAGKTSRAKATLKLGALPDNSAVVFKASGEGDLWCKVNPDLFSECQSHDECANNEYCRSFRGNGGLLGVVGNFRLNPNLEMEDIWVLGDEWQMKGGDPMNVFGPRARPAREARAVYRTLDEGPIGFCDYIGFCYSGLDSVDGPCPPMNKVAVKRILGRDMSRAITAGLSVALAFTVIGFVVLSYLVSDNILSLSYEIKIISAVILAVVVIVAAVVVGLLVFKKKKSREIVFAFDKNSLYAVDATTGAQKWKFAATAGDVRPSPAVSADGGTVFVGSNAIDLYAVDATTGDEKWKFAAGAYVGSSPAVSADGGTVFVGSSDNSLYAVDATTGAQKWKFATGGYVESSPAVSADGGTVFVGSDDSNLYAVHATNGQEKGTQKWKFAAKGAVRPSPAVSADGGTVFVGSNDNSLYAVHATDGDQKWKFETEGDVRSSPAVSADGGTVFVGSNDGKLYAVDATNGKEKWKFATEGPVHPSPAVSADGGTVFVGSNDYHLYAVDATNGKEKWKFATGGWVAPTAVGADGGTVVAWSNDGNLYAVDVTNGTKRWQFAAALGPLATRVPQQFQNVFTDMI